VTEIVDVSNDNAIEVILGVVSGIAGLLITFVTGIVGASNSDDAKAMDATSRGRRLAETLRCTGGPGLESG
jgi:hypothetical protein